jgi:hypothetical protein
MTFLCGNELLGQQKWKSYQVGRVRFFSPNGSIWVLKDLEFDDYSKNATFLSDKMHFWKVLTEKHFSEKSP